MGAIDRRGVLAGVTALGLATGARAHDIATGVTRPVKTSNGPVVGLTEGGVSSFKGVRYGAPPVGDLRWEPPKRPEPWKDPALCARFGQASIQLSSGGSAVRYPGTIGAALDQLMGSSEDVRRQSEDCLFLNVWSPGLDTKGRPVMVWFHGGGYNYGSGSWAAYDGTNLARNHDVVVVTVNHRLNAIGFLNLADVGGHPSSGNAGMLDLVLVLEWVRDNIAEFGGNPGNVTVFGQSGGGGKVSTTLAMPGADKLRHKAIIQSGPGIRVGDPGRASEAAKQVMKAVGAADLKALREVPYAAILRAARGLENPGGMGGLRWGPILEAGSIPAHPFEPQANPLARDVPVMVGVTSDEQTLYNVGFDWWGKASEADILARLETQYADRAEGLLAAAKALHPKDSPSYLYTDVTSMGPFVTSALLAERKAAQAAPVYMYVWEWGAPADGGMMRSPHTLEIPFAFDNVDRGPLLLGMAASTKALGKAASTAWTSFARTGDPNGRSGLPAWPRYDAGKRATMIFNTKSRIENDPYAAFRKLMPPRGF
jgi:para-nitrobenzyl esterase